MICSGNFAWLRLCCLLQMWARTWMRGASARCGSTAQSAVTVVGEIPSRTFLGCVVVTLSARGELTSADGPAGPCPSLRVVMLCVKRRYALLDSHRQSYSFLLSPTKLLLLIRNWLSVLMCRGLTGPSWYSCCSVFLEIAAGFLDVGLNDSCECVFCWMPMLNNLRLKPWPFYMDFLLFTCPSIG